MSTKRLQKKKAAMQAKKEKQLLIPIQLYFLYIPNQ